MDIIWENYIDDNSFHLNLMLCMSMLQEKITLLQIIWQENMSSLDKGKATMEQLDSTQLIQNFEDILINVNEYCEAVNGKIEIIEEIIVDLRADLVDNIFPPNYWTV